MATTMEYDDVIGGMGRIITLGREDAAIGDGATKFGERSDVVKNHYSKVRVMCCLEKTSSLSSRT